ncbi:MAG TPA: amidohydrolase family protein [Steroidobacteraceae bacterium]|nr:amidohydrolase family protein [Steroidobacteraceae bacterium]
MRMSHLAVTLVFALVSFSAGAESIELHNVRVIDVRAVAPARAADITVENGRITAIEKPGAASGSGNRVIDGEQRYLVAGLSEMHAHLPTNAGERAATEDLLKLYVANGITNIRSMLGDTWHLQLRDEVATGKVLGPRIFAGAPSLNGRTAPDPATGARLAREYAAAGFDFLKLHPGLRCDVFDAIARAADAAKIPFAGHVSEDVGIDRALEARYAVIDHLDGYLDGLADPQCRRDRPPGFFGIALIDCMDAARIQPLVQRTLSAGTWNVATESFLEGFAHPPASVEALRARPDMKYLPPATAENWMSARARFLGAQAPTPAQFDRFLDLRRRLIDALQDSGAPLLVGSDAPQIFNVPGFSAHNEMTALMKAGVPPHVVLQAATVNVARHFRRESEFGRVAVGQAADLVLLDANPLESIDNTRKIAGVMVRGQWFDRAALDAMLAGVAARQASR